MAIIERSAKMDVELWGALLNAISSVGFPIVVAGCMFWKMNEQDKDHKEELARVTEAINNNSLALQKLVDRLDNRGL